MLPLLAQALGSKVPKASAGNPRKEQVGISMHLRSTFPFSSSPSCRAARLDEERAGSYVCASASGPKALTIGL